MASRRRRRGSKESAQGAAEGPRGHSRHGRERAGASGLALRQARWQDREGIQQGQDAGREAHLPAPPRHQDAHWLPPHEHNDEADATGRPRRHREAFTNCDVANYRREGTTPFKSGCWWVVIPLIAIQWLRHGAEDPALGLELDISGAVNVVLRLGLLTHIDNLIPFFRGRVPKESEVVRFLDDDVTNAKVTTRWTNEFWTSVRVSTIYTVMEALKPCVGTVLERVEAEVGATQEEIAVVTSPSRPALSEEQVKWFRLNGQEYWEE